MNILYLADPKSIHDIKWIAFFSLKKEYNCFLISRTAALANEINALEEHNIQYCGSINDYSTLWVWKNYPSRKKLANTIKRNQIDLFHVLYTEPNVLWTNVVRSYSIPVIATNRGSDILITINNFFKSKSILNRLVSSKYLKAFENCEYITTTSKKQITTLKKYVNSRNIKLIRTGIDFEVLDNLRSKHDLLFPSKSYILFPRNMRPVYNHELSLNAIKLLPVEIKEEYNFVFLDSDSFDKTYTSLMKRKIEAISDSTIHLLKKQTHRSLISLIENAKLVVMTNNSDGTPVTALESMYLKTPLLLSPLDYDDIFLGVRKFTEFTAQSVADSITHMIKKNIDDKDLEPLKELVIKCCDRQEEMKKLAILYEKAVPVET